MKKFVEKIESLDNICQWSERDSIIKESVSQHSFKVAAIANYLLRSVCARGYDIPDSFKTEVLSYAIMHDFDEALFGRDVSHVVKYNSYNGENIRNAINEYVEHLICEDFPELDLNPAVAVKKFVKLCDWIALLTFVIRNQNMGAKTFSFEKHYCKEKFIETVQDVNHILFSEFDIEVDLNTFIKIDEL